MEVFLVHVDVLPFLSRVRVGSPHAPGFVPYARTHREEQNQCSSHRFITMLIAFSSRLLLILAAERSRCSETGRGRSDEITCPPDRVPTIRSGVLEYLERGQDAVWWTMWYEDEETHNRSVISWHNYRSSAPCDREPRSGGDDWLRRSRDHAGSSLKQVWVVQMSRSELLFMTLQTQEPQQPLAELATSARPFDRWLREQFQLLLGWNLQEVLPGQHHDLIFSWSDESADP